MDKSMIFFVSAVVGGLQNVACLSVGLLQTIQSCAGWSQDQQEAERVIIALSRWDSPSMSRAGHWPTLKD